MNADMAILGGSFDPVHNGHLHLLKCVLTMTDFSTVVLVPANQSNFKQTAVACATAEQRLDMLNLAIGDFADAYPNLLQQKKLIIDDIEIKKGGVSYTIDTVKAIIGKYGIPASRRMGLIIGDDHLPRLAEWEGFEELKKLVVFLVFQRFGITSPVPEGTQCIFIDNPIFQGSSTEIRNGEREEELLPPRVEEYVREHALYR
ncbi:MAG: nicotinate (nicotinamide) nucleotide adenylyltransferase [Spirochaetales bacterium]|nr:nicotinate (nicotinamide) nucleotide adenylyltransferase [Spirochaetales bacterium]